MFGKAVASQKLYGALPRGPETKLKEQDHTTVVLSDSERASEKRRDGRRIGQSAWRELGYLYDYTMLFAYRLPLIGHGRLVRLSKMMYPALGAVS